MKPPAPWLVFSLGSAFFAGLTAILGKLGVEGLAFAIVLGVVVLGEPMSWRLALGGGLVVAGALVIAAA